MRILMVDDDMDDRALFQEAVFEVDASIECITTKDGQQALNLLKELHLPLPDLIFLDLRMPRISGKRCLQEIKKEERLKDIPIIIYTTSRELDESKQLQNMGAIYFVSKPTNPEDIYYLVSQIIEEHRNASRERSHISTPI